MHSHPLHLTEREEGEEADAEVAVDEETLDKKKSTTAKPTPTADGNASKRKLGSSKGVSVGQLINLLASDANTIVEGFLICVPALFQAVDIAACIVWCGYEAGWIAAPLLGLTILFVVLQFYCGSRVGEAKTIAAGICDQRLRALTEFLSGIQVVKFYAWEENVRQMIYAIRKKEAAMYIRSSNWKMVIFALVFTSTGVFAVVVFALKYTYDGDVMLPSETFLIMTLISYVMRGFAWLPRCLSGLATAGASVSRIQTLLAKDVTVGLPTVMCQAPADPATTSNAPDSDSGVPPLRRRLRCPPPPPTCAWPPRHWDFRLGGLCHPRPHTRLP